MASSLRCEQLCDLQRVANPVIERTEQGLFPLFWALRLHILIHEKQESVFSLKTADPQGISLSTFVSELMICNVTFPVAMLRKSGIERQRNIARACPAGLTKEARGRCLGARGRTESRVRKQYL